MAASDFHTWLAELKDKNDIVSVVSAYVHLTRKGRLHWGNCPFHHEKTPSFCVNEELQIYKCFGCGAAGDVIKFVQESEHTDFNGAVQMLAERAGMEVPRFGRENTAADKKREELANVMKAAQAYFVEQLSTPQAAQARAYLDGRGLDDSMIQRFGIGFAPPGWENLKSYLLSQGFPANTIQETGLMSIKDSRSYDKFRNRIMFPICDEKGVIISYGGRKINPEDEPKYMNCPQTLLYNKSQTLYALNIAKNYSKGTSLIIVEGYMDVITMHQFGFSTAIASCGTSLTQQQARKIKRYVDKVYIGYDGDGAGQAATIRGLDILKNTGLDVRVLSFPNGLDPDETLRQYGADYFKEIIENAKKLEEFKISRIFSLNDMNSKEGKLRAAKQAVQVAASVDSDMERESYVAMISRATGYSERAVFSDIERLRGGVDRQKQPTSVPVVEKKKESVRQSVPVTAKKKSVEEQYESRLVCLMVRDKEAALETLNIVYAAGFSVEVCRKIVEAIQRIFEKSEEFNISGILEQIDPEFRDQAYEILISDVQSSDIREECAAYAKKVKRHYFQQKVKEVQELANDYIIRGEIANPECQRLLREIETLKKTAMSI